MPAAASREPIEEFPSRAPILKDPLDAHREEIYNLSVPALLAQADGICYEFAGAQLYSRRDKRMRVRDFVECLDERSVTRAMADVLANPTPLTATEDERASLPAGHLNRHVVLHGVDVTYGTDVNSFKAISWLYFVAWVVRLQSQ